MNRNTATVTSEPTHYNQPEIELTVRWLSGEAASARDYVEVAVVRLLAQIADPPTADNPTQEDQ